MKVTIITRHECDYTRELADAYIDNELLVETSLRITAHLERCAECRQYVMERAMVKDRIRESVRGQASPPELKNQVLSKLEEERQ